MSMYSLTHLTGSRKNEGRVSVVQGFEFQRKTLMVVGISTGIGFLPAVILALTLSPFFLLIVPAIIAVLGYWLFVTQSREGMKLSRYKSIMDKKNANLNEFHICFEPISDIPSSGIAVKQTVEVITEEREAEHAATVISAPSRAQTPKQKKRDQRPTSAIIG